MERQAVLPFIRHYLKLYTSDLPPLNKRIKGYSNYVPTIGSALICGLSSVNTASIASHVIRMVIRRLSDSDVIE